MQTLSAYTRKGFIFVPWPAKKQQTIKAERKPMPKLMKVLPSNTLTGMH
jgi:hypothetical protein